MKEKNNLVPPTGDNISDIRALIYKLEDAPTYDELAWLHVLDTLAASPCALEDATRRMRTAQLNKPAAQLPPPPPPCRHANTMLYSAGGWRFLDCEPFDDVIELELCLDCGRLVGGDADADYGLELPF